MSEPRLYLYRKAGREVWDAEMWLSDGRRRVWRTGIADRASAEEAARARLEALVGEMNGAAAAASCSGNSHEPDSFMRACVPEPAPPPAPAEMKASADIPARAGKVTQAIEAAEDASCELDVVSASEKPGRVFQTKALIRFDRWFFGELASLWRVRA